MKFNHLFFLCFILFFESISSKTNIQLSIHESNVANVYYQIVEKNIPIQKELEYTLTSNKKQYQGIIKDSILFIENVPFGEYTLKIKEPSYTYSFTINKNYLKSHHILKELDISKHLSFNTSDSNNITFYIFLFGITTLLLIILLLKNHN